MLCCATSWLKPIFLISQPPQHNLCFSCSHTHFSKMAWCWCAHRRQHILPPFLFFIFHTLHCPLGSDFSCSQLVSLNTFFLPYIHFQSVLGKVWSLKIARAKIYSDSRSTERRKNYYKILHFFFFWQLIIRLHFIHLSCGQSKRNRKTVVWNCCYRLDLVASLEKRLKCCLWQNTMLNQASPSVPAA